VWALSEGTGEEFSTQSGEDGRFSLIVPKGNYTVGVSSPGFRPYSVSGVKVKPGKNSKLDVTIQLPILGESISVYPDAPPPPLNPVSEEITALMKVLTAPFRALKSLFGG
jgi:hypothetical protein